MAEKVLIQREDFLAHRCTFEEYYRSVRREAGYRLRAGHPMVERARVALAAGDEHLNTIPLLEWDNMLIGFFGLSRAFKAHGDYLTAAGAVCFFKQGRRTP